ncbi:hypothetical protein PGB90_008163 [Kerria lacca]
MKKIILIGSTTAAIGVILLGIRYIVTWKSPKILEQTIEDDEKNSRLKIPRYSSDIPKKIPYLLIGGGTASFSAFRAIKSRDPTAKIEFLFSSSCKAFIFGLAMCIVDCYHFSFINDRLKFAKTIQNKLSKVLIISNEIYFPYMRPPLSKEMWFENNENNFTKLNFKQWNGTERSLLFEMSKTFPQRSPMDNIIIYDPVERQNVQEDSFLPFFNFLFFLFRSLRLFWDSSLVSFNFSVVKFVSEQLSSSTGTSTTTFLLFGILTAVLGRYVVSITG